MTQDPFTEKSQAIIKEFVAGLRKRSPMAATGKGKQKGDDIEMTDSDLEDDDVIKAAAAGDKVGLGKAVRNKRVRDKKDLEQKIRDLPA